MTIYSLPHTGEKQIKTKSFIHEQQKVMVVSSLPCLYLCFSRTSIVPSKYLMTMMIIVMMIGFYFFARHVSHFLCFTPTLYHTLLTHSLSATALRGSTYRGKLPVTGQSNYHIGCFFFSPNNSLNILKLYFPSGVCSWSVSPGSCSCGRSVCTTRRRGCLR